MTITAKLFMSGRSQAIRLPAKLRLQAREVRIEKIGNAFWLQPQGAEDQDMAKWLQSFYSSTEVLPEEFLTIRQDEPPQGRDWS